MWIVAKIKLKEIYNFKKEMKKKLGNDIEFYYPTMLFNSQNKNKSRILKKMVLGSYIFCKHQSLEKNELLNQLKFTVGLNYFLLGYKYHQKQILNFIKYCKENEDLNGNLNQSFFSNLLKTSAKFMSGSLYGLIFEVVNKQKNRLSVLVNSKKIVVNKKSGYLYLPV